MQPILLADPEDRHDIGVLQPRRRAGFQPKSLEIG
jgi:hypothetical protein